MPCSVWNRARISSTGSSPGSSRTSRGTARPTRERSVARTGKKWGRQKGSGGARHGDRGAPIFIGGGKAHGARKRDFEQSLNKKVRALGLKMALSSKAQDPSGSGLVIVDTLELADAKTKALAGTFGKNGWNGKVLVIDGESVNDGFRRAAGNLPGIDVLPAMGANVYDILNHDTLVLTREAVEKLEARFNG